MKSRRWLFKLVAGVLALGLTAAACGGNDTGAEGDGERSPVPGGATGVETAAADLNASLTSLLDSHVYMAGVAVVSAKVFGLDSPEFEAAAAALDTNTQDLQDAITSLYGEEAGTQFGDLWRKHIGFFVSLAEGYATGDQAQIDEANANLEGYRADFGEFLDGAGILPKEAVAEALGPHTQTLDAAIESVMTGEGDPFAALYDAGHGTMPPVATALAGGIAENQGIEGQVDSPEAQLRRDLTSLLNGHVYMAGVTVFAAKAFGLDSPEFEAAAATLDTNTQDLQDAITSLYGEEAGSQFGDLWRKHIGFFVSLAEGYATGDQAQIDEANANLEGYRADFGEFLDGAGILPKEAVAEALGPHVETLDAAIVAVMTGEGDPFAALYDAGHGTMPPVATALANGIVDSKPDVFGSS